MGSGTGRLDIIRLWGAQRRTGLRTDLSARVAAGLLALTAAALALALLVVASPLLAASKLALAFSRVPIRVRCAARLVLLSAAYLVIFQVGVLAGLAVAGHDRRRFDAFLAGVTRRFFDGGLRFAGMRLVRERPVPQRDGRPLILLARHAGFINGTLLLHEVIESGRKEHIGVARHAANADIGLWAVLRRMGWKTYRWNAKGKGELLMRLLAMAGAIQPGQTLALFPEGTNYTAERRRRVIARLRRNGRAEEADRAERLRYTVDPTAGGSRALVATAPGADVLFFGHTGLEDLLSWTGRFDYPPSGDGLVRVAWWRVPAEDVPRGRKAFDAWLHGWWQTVDDWIGQVRRTPQDDEEVRHAEHRPRP